MPPQPPHAGGGYNPMFMLGLGDALPPLALGDTDEEAKDARAESSPSEEVGCYGC